MKKIILGLTIILFLTPLYSSEQDIISQNTLGMGNAGLADVSGVSNPANLGSRGEGAPSLITDFTFMESLKPNLITSPIGLFQYPTISMGVTVFGTNLSLALNIDSSLEDREYYDSILHYTGYNKFTLQLDWGYRLNSFDFGMRLKGGSSTQRNNFELRDNVFFIPDYIVNSFLSTYYPLSGSDFFSLGFALRLNVSSNLSAAIMSESDLDLSTSSDNITSYLKGASLGFTYISNIYTSTNRLNTFVYKASIDLIKIGDADNRELRMGNELKMQLGDNRSLAFRAGYYETKETIAKIFTFNSDEGVSTFAFAYNSNDFDLSLSLFLPIKSYVDLDNGFTVAFNSKFRF